MSTLIGNTIIPSETSPSLKHRRVFKPPNEMVFSADTLLIARWRLILIFFVLSTNAAAVLAHSESFQTSHSTHLHGRVLNEIGGQPISGAEVMSSDSTLLAVSADDGTFDIECDAFRIDRSIPGQPVMWIKATHPDFVRAESFTPIRLMSFMDGQEAQIKLQPYASLQGRVSGKQITTADQASLWRRDTLYGVTHWVRDATEQLDSEGAYRFSRLVAADYLVLYSPSATSCENRNCVMLTGPLQAVSGNSDSFDQGSVLRLSPGSQTENNLTPQTGDRYRLRIKFSRELTGKLKVTLLKEGSVTGYAFEKRLSGNEFVAFVPPGGYELRVTSESGTYLSRELMVSDASLDRDYSREEFTSASLKVKVDYEDGRTTRSHSTVVILQSLSADDESNHQIFLDSAKPVGGFSHLADGAYILQARSSRGYIASMMCGSVDLLREPLAIRESGNCGDITILVRDDGATLKGSLKTELNDGGRDYVLLSALDGTHQVFWAHLDLDGNFEIGDVPPNLYQLRRMSLKEARNFPYYSGQGTIASPVDCPSVNLMVNQILDLKSLISCENQ